MARDELLLTLQVEWLPLDGKPVTIIREQATCADVFGLCAEIEQAVGPRFRAAISEAFLSGTRDVDAARTAG